MQDPLPPCPRLSGTAHPGRPSCQQSHEVAPALHPHGASPPPGRTNPSFPPHHTPPHGPPPCWQPPSLLSSTPNPWGWAGGWGAGIFPAPETQLERSDLGILLGFGQCEARRSAPGQPRAEEVFGYWLGVSVRSGCSPSPCLQSVFGAGAAKEAAPGSRLGMVGWRW